MSADIYFWKQEQPLTISSFDVVGELNSERLVNGLAALPTEEMVDDLRESIDLESMDYYFADQYFRFGIGRGVDNDALNEVVEIMAEYGCPMYDPQSDERHDADHGMSVGELPVFRELTPQELAEQDRRIKEFIHGPALSRSFWVVPVVLLLAFAFVIVVSSYESGSEEPGISEQSAQELMELLEQGEGGESLRKLYDIPATAEDPEKQ